MLYRRLFPLRDSMACRKGEDRLHSLGSLDIDSGKIFILDDNELTLLVFVPLDDLIPRDFLAVGFRYALVEV
jgi:hypothetical protein